MRSSTRSAKRRAGRSCCRGSSASTSLHRVRLLSLVLSLRSYVHLTPFIRWIPGVRQLAQWVRRPHSSDDTAPSALTDLTSHRCPCVGDECRPQLRPVPRDQAAWLPLCRLVERRLMGLGRREEEGRRRVQGRVETRRDIVIDEVVLLTGSQGHFCVRSHHLLVDWRQQGRGVVWKIGGVSACSRSTSAADPIIALEFSHCIPCCCCCCCPLLSLLLLEERTVVSRLERAGLQ